MNKNTQKLKLAFKVVSPVSLLFLGSSYVPLYPLCPPVSPVSPCVPRISCVLLCPFVSPCVSLYFIYPPYPLCVTFVHYVTLCPPVSLVSSVVPCLVLCLLVSPVSLFPLKKHEVYGGVVLVFHMARKL